MGTVITTDQPQDKLTRREMLRLSAAGMAALQGTGLFASVVRPAAAASSPATYGARVAMEFARAAEQAGADGLLLFPPYRLAANSITTMM